MTQDVILRMAREAGFGPACAWPEYSPPFERFAALVAAAAKAEEREACAQACDAVAEPLIGAAYAEVAHDCADAIRARSQA